MPSAAVAGQYPEVLIVEDEFALRRLMSMLLQDEGFTVRTAGNGIEGLAQLALRPADLLLVDLMMPGMNGRDFLMEARRTGHDTPAIMVSASAEAEQVAGELGCAGFMPKPYDFNLLVTEMRRVLQRAKTPV